MPIIDTIFWLIWDISDWFLDAAITVSRWIPPFNLLATPLRFISDAFWDLLYPIASFNDWADAIAKDVQELGIWGAIKNLIIGWLPGLEPAIIWVDNLVSGFRVFAADPIAWIKDKTTTVIIPWAEDNIPWFATIHTWVTNFQTELELFFDNPAQYFKDKFKNVILPWAKDNIPFYSILYTWLTNFRTELELFFSNPILYLKNKVETVIVPWAVETIPFVTTLAIWVTNFRTILEAFFEDPVKWLRSNTIWGDVEEFFTSPLDWLVLRLEDWFWGVEEEEKKE